MTRYLVDTNVLLRMADPSAAYHTVAYLAVSMLFGAGHDLSVTAQVLIEFWAVATRPTSSNGLGWDSRRTADQVARLMAQFPLLPDTEVIFPRWRALVAAHAVAGKQAHDARLAAVMETHGVTHLLTFNTGDFQRYPGVTAVHPADATVNGS
jgi:predicted nucleic acid-binding protein